MPNDVKRNPIILIHGYSATYEAFTVWKQKLQEKGYDVLDIHILNYVSLTNEITIKDIAEGFDQALSNQINLEPEQEFDAIVHSTGMLVIRAWLTAYSKKRRNRLKHLIGLAPATFGSPIAHKGRSFIGAMFKGNRKIGHDFLEAGNLILDALELGSKFTWDLTHKDLFGSEVFYGLNSDTPYVFTFCGTQGYEGLAGLVNEPGTDGTVRWAGFGLNTRKICIDLTKQGTPDQPRIQFAEWNNLGIAPPVLVRNLNHSSILDNPSDELVEIVDQALHFSPDNDIKAWYAKATSTLTPSGIGLWQQFIVRAIDERGDAITDYYVYLSKDKEGSQPIENFGVEVHTYSGDKSLRCFHVNLDKILDPNDLHRPTNLENLTMRVIASSGSELVEYLGISKEPSEEDTDKYKWDAEIDISELLQKSKIKFFYPYTTTFIELRLNREPCPDQKLININKVAQLIST